MKEIYKIIEGYNEEKLELAKVISRSEDYYRSGNHDAQINDVLNRIKEIDEIIEEIVRRLITPAITTLEGLAANKTNHD